MKQPQEVQCPVCGAPPGAHCVSKSGKRYGSGAVHSGRNVEAVAATADKPTEWAAEWVSAATHVANTVKRLREKAFADPNAPGALLEHCTQIRDAADAIIALIEGREAMEEVWP